MFIYHIADLHIKEEEEENIYIIRALNKFIEYVRNDNIDRKNKKIFIIGDIVDKKTINHSRYCIKFIKDILIKMSELCDVYILLGNHDYTNQEIEKNMINLIDFIKDLVDMKKIYIIDNLEYYFGKFCLNSIEHYDKEIHKPFKVNNLTEQFNIFLYHGDLNNKLYNKSFSINLFKEYDLVLLGHYHEYYKIADNIAYCGSLIQNNFGESNNHGFIIWNTDTKTHQFIPINSIHKYLIINDTNEKINNKCEIINYDDVKTYKTKKKLFIKVYSNKSKDEINNYLFHYFNSNQIKLIKYEKFNNKIVKEIKQNLQQIYNIDNNSSLINLYKDILFNNKDNNDEENNRRLKIIIDIINELELQDKKKDPKNITLRRLEFSNILTYGEGNIIDFDNIKNSKIIGISGENGIGKTSILKILIYSIYGNLLRNKNEYISYNKNQYKKDKDKDKYTGNTKIILDVNNSTYLIDTTINFYKSRINEIRYVYKLIDNNKNNIDINDLKNYEIINNLNDKKKVIIFDYEKEFGDYNDFINACIIKQKDIGISSLTDIERFKLFSNKFNIDFIKLIYSKLLNNKKYLSSSINKSLNSIHFNLNHNHKSIDDKINSILFSQSSLLNDLNILSSNLSNSQSLLSSKLDDLNNLNLSNHLDNNDIIKQNQNLINSLNFDFQIFINTETDNLNSNILNIKLNNSNSILSNLNLQLQNIQSNLSLLKTNLINSHFNFNNFNINDIKSLNNDKKLKQHHLTDIQHQINQLDLSLNFYNDNLHLYNEEINKIKNNNIHINNLQSNLTNLNNQLLDLQNQSNLLNNEINLYNSNINNLNSSITFKFNSNCKCCIHNKQLCNYDKIKQDISNFNNLISNNQNKLNDLNEQINNLKFQINNLNDEINNLKSLSFNVDLIKSFEDINIIDLREQKNKLLDEQKEINNFLNNFNDLKKYLKLQKQFNDINEQINNEKEKIKIEQDKQINQLKDNFNNLKLQKEKEKNNKIKKLENEIQQIKDDIYNNITLKSNQLNQDIKDLQININNLIQEKNDKENLNNIYSNLLIDLNRLKDYDYIINYADENTIINKIINSTLSNLNILINNLSYPIINKEIYFEFKDNSLMIKDKDKDYDIRLYSGGEKEIIDVIFNIILNDFLINLKVNIKFIDEMLISVDKNRIDYLDEFFNELKARFDKIFIISHEDKIKDFYDINFNILKISSNPSNPSNSFISIP